MCHLSLSLSLFCIFILSLDPFVSYYVSLVIGNDESSKTFFNSMIMALGLFKFISILHHSWLFGQTCLGCHFHTRFCSILDGQSCVLWVEHIIHIHVREVVCFLAFFEGIKGRESWSNPSWSHEKTKKLQVVSLGKKETVNAFPKRCHFWLFFFLIETTLFHL